MVRVVQNVPAFEMRPNYQVIGCLTEFSLHCAPYQFPPEEGDVRNGEAEGVNLGEALLVGEGRHVQTKLLEGRVDARRAARDKIR